MTNRSLFLLSPRLVRNVTIVFLILFGLSQNGFSQEAAKKKEKTKTAAEKPDPSLTEIVDDPKLPRVLLIGDSISMGYTIPTRNLLQGKANVHRVLTNGGPTTNGLAHLKQWLGTGKWAVVHFNWGLHDLKYMEDGSQQVPIDQYEKNLRELVKELQGTGAKLIWCSTTPVPDAKVSPPRKNADVIAYNAVAEKVMKENQIKVDDLYGYVFPQLSQYQRPANVHYTNDGYNFLAKQVASSIEGSLNEK